MVVKRYISLHAITHHYHYHYKNRTPGGPRYPYTHLRPTGVCIVPKMEAPIQAPAPHPSRPRTRDSNDPQVVQARLYALQYQRRMRQEKPEEFLANKREYNLRHKEERNAKDRARYVLNKEDKNAKDRARYARKKAEQAAQALVPAI